jgi:hypothetical protein
MCMNFFTISAFRNPAALAQILPSPLLSSAQFERKAEQGMGA